MNKDKKEIKIIDGKKYTGYKCRRCNVWIPAKQWKNDTHSKCDFYLKTRTIRDKVNKSICGKINKFINKRRPKQ